MSLTEERRLARIGSMREALVAISSRAAVAIDYSDALTDDPKIKEARELLVKARILVNQASDIMEKFRSEARI